MRQIFFQGQIVKNLGIFGQKIERLVPQTWNFSWIQFRSCYYKNLENNKFVAAAVLCEFDIWNIQIFSKYFHNLDKQKYLDLVFNGYVQLVPSTLSTSFPQPVYIATDSLAFFTAAEHCFQLVPKYKLKVKLQRRKHPNIFIWNNSCLRKWQPRSSFWQILIFQIP